MKSTQQIRRDFLSYFRKSGHTIIASSPSVPHDDPTLLFTNAGMNQFKDVFLGKSVRDYSTAATSQKCIRVGGKHNDLENVGHTSRHLTFFEMLGNFSFGDYFKEKAIQYAWEVSTNVFGFDPDRIWPTVFTEDDEAFEIWKKYVPAKRITRLGEKDNFWAMGDLGPCGPCSELLYDKGAQYGTGNNPLEDTTGERFFEFWNLVFMQFNTTATNRIVLPKPSIDTGAGLERVMSLIQGKESVFETDVLRGIISEIENISGVTYNQHNSNSAAFRVIADHIRALAFAISDGASPSNTDRGYVLRKIIRRAVRYGKSIGFTKPFLARLLPRLIHLMGDDYIEIKKAGSHIEEILTQEEESFFKTLARGGMLLNQVIEKSSKDGMSISGHDAFTLKDTYGMPIDEILLIAKDYNLTVDLQNYEKLEEEARQKSKAAHKNKAQAVISNTVYEKLVHDFGPSQFLRDCDNAESRIIAIIANNEMCTHIEQSAEALVILDRTPFYAEMGGQIGDSGTIKNNTAEFIVHETFSPYKGITAHKGVVTQGTLKTNTTVTCEIDRKKRRGIECNHSATHLLHWALHKVLGEHARQAGSLVDYERLRFDFNHHKQLTKEEIREIETLVNDKIRENIPISAYEMEYDVVQTKKEIKQFFGDKYDRTVRVLDMNISKELCGGTHTTHTGNIGYFRITKETSIAAGVRRIEAITGQLAEQYAYSKEDLLQQSIHLLKTTEHAYIERLEKHLTEYTALEKQVAEYKRERIATLAQSLPASNNSICQLVQIAASDLKSLLEELVKKHPEYSMALVTADQEKVHILVRIPKNIAQNGTSAEKIIKGVATQLNGNGGGKLELAQAAIRTNSYQEAMQIAKQAHTLLLEAFKVIKL